MKKIYLNRDKRAFTLVDDENYEWLNQWVWMLNSTGYAYRQESTSSGYVTYLMHRLLVMPPIGMQVDHINRNKLDNRVENLRAVTIRDNLMNRDMQRNNTSGYVGVKRQNSKKNPWRVVVKYFNKEHHLGVFSNIQEAVKVRDEFIVKMGG